MFANLLVDDSRRPPAAATMETLEPTEFFDVFGEFYPSAVTNGFTDLSFLNALHAPDSLLRKRLLSDDNESSSMCKLLSASAPVVYPPFIAEKKPRKPSHIIAKEAREELQAQVRHLEIQRLLLRQELGLVDLEVAAAKDALNLDLHNTVLQHDMQLASAQSFFSGYVSSRATSPLETYIHLGTDWNERRSTLLEMKDQKIAIAHQFLLERTRHINPFKPSRESSTFETDQGDVCAVTVDVVPILGAKSVREVYEAFQFFFTNVDIVKTEVTGKVTIRENEASVDNSVMHHRLVSSEEGGVLQETNVVLFCDASGLDSKNVEDQCVVMTDDFVNKDDLYPYRPSERVRKDVNSVIKLSIHRRPRPQTRRGSTRRDGKEEEKDGELVITFMRWGFARLHRPEIDVPKQVLQSMSGELNGYIDAILKSTWGGLRPMKKEASWH